MKTKHKTVTLNQKQLNLLIDSITSPTGDAPTTVDGLHELFHGKSRKAQLDRWLFNNAVELCDTGYEKILKTKARTWREYITMNWADAAAGYDDSGLAAWLKGEFDFSCTPPTLKDYLTRNAHRIRGISWPFTKKRKKR